jgi:hypothetical protein
VIGRIRVDGRWGGLAPASIMWTERYAPALGSCAGLGHARAWFGPPVAGDGILPLSHDNYLAGHRGCPGSSVRDEDGGVVHEMGGPALNG